MTSFRLRYKDGVFAPIDPMPDFRDGDEIEVEWVQPMAASSIDDELNRTRGLWADWDGSEESVEDSRK